MKNKSHKLISFLLITFLLILQAGILAGATRTSTWNKISQANRLYNQLKQQRNLTGSARIHYDAAVRSLNKANRYFNRRAYNAAYAAARSAVHHFNAVNQQAKSLDAIAEKLKNIRRLLSSKKRDTADSQKNMGLYNKAKQDLENAAQSLDSALKNLNAIRKILVFNLSVAYSGQKPYIDLYINGKFIRKIYRTRYVTIKVPRYKRASIESRYANARFSKSVFMHKNIEMTIIKP